MFRFPLSKTWIKQLYDMDAGAMYRCTLIWMGCNRLPNMKSDIDDDQRTVSNIRIIQMLTTCARGKVDGS